ncbi:MULTISPECIES: hypothetical protein [unclassified Mycobacterium]|uniref:hypothetical protein n=1 Tax=unclassified Mycobacterium TaxID=2642494 RepID=UPI000A53801B|nr:MULTISPECIES: hypothetical protein [unclassified Mycobacterium]
MAVGGALNLSALLAWPTDHLIEAAAHWEAVSEHSYGVVHQVWRDGASVDWRGEAADTLRSATHADLQATSAAVDQLQAATQVARSGASDLYAARSRVRYAVDDARSAGFEVGEDLSVTDRMGGGSAAERAARHAAAQAFAGEIRQSATQLVGVDQQVASKITAAVAGIRDTFPQPRAPIAPPPARNGHIYAVDRVWKQDGGNGEPNPEPAGSPSGDDIRGVLDRLPVGNQPFVREVRSAEDLQNLWKWAKQHGVEIPNGYGDASKGTRYRLPDGTTIGQRWNAESNGKPALDIDIRDQGGYTKVHINPRGGVPEIPAAAAPRPAGPSAVEEPAVTPQTPVRAPAEAAPPVKPAPGAPEGAGAMPGFGGLPPNSPATGPHPIHIPHTLDHKWPLLGEIPEEFEGPRE